MPLASQLVHVPFAGGVDTKKDEKLVLPGKLVDLKNGIFKTHDIIQKRNGYSVFGTNIVGGSSISAAESLATFLDEILAINKGTVYSYSSGLDKWVSRGTIPSPMVRSADVVRNSAQQTMPDMAINAGIAVYAWEDSRNGIRCSVLDHVSGVPFQADASVTTDASATRPRCLAVGKFLFIVWVEGANLKQRRIDITAPQTLEAESTLRTDVSSHMDAVSLGVTDNSKAVVAYTTTGSQVTLFYLTEAGGVGNPLNDGVPGPASVAENAASALGLLVSSAGDFYVCLHNTTDGVRIFALESDFTVLFAPTDLDASTTTQVDNICGVEESSTSFRWFYEVNAAASYNQLVSHNTISNAGVAGTAAVFLRSVGLAHKAFRQDSVTYVGLAHDSTLQATYFLADASGNIHAKTKPRVGGGLTARTGLPQVINSDTDVWVWAALRKTRLVSELNEDSENVTFTVTGVARSTYEFGTVERFLSDQLGQNLHLAGGALFAYDGRTLAEHGFHLFPENCALAETGTGGSMPDGTYGFAVFFQWVDNRGQIHRSAPWLGSITLTAGTGTSKVTVTVPTLRLTGKSNVTVEVYSTEDAGSIYYKVSSTTNPTSNDTTADTVTFDRTAADASILANELLYTTGGVVENIAAPPCAGVFAGRTRLWVIDAEDRDVVWYSKPYVDDRDRSVEFSDVFRMSVPPEGGDLVAVAQLDDKVVLFKKTRIYVIFGAGPNVLGQQNSFSEPEILSTDVGCQDARSLVLTQAGLMFQSTKGIYLLNRGLAVDYIGEAVQAYNDETVTAAVMIEDDNQVRFLLEAEDSGRALVFDYSVGQWSTFTDHAGVGAVLSGGVFHFVTSAGVVHKEVPGTFLDNGVPYSLELTTAWLKLAGLQGFQRVRRIYLLGDRKDSHKLDAIIGYDYQPYFEGALQWDVDSVIDANVWGAEATWGDASVWGGVTDGVYQFRAHLSKQKCQSIRLRIKDVAADGESFSLASLALEVGIKKGGYKLRSGKSLGVT